MSTSPLPLRVAVVQMHAHLAVEAPGHIFLGEPLGEANTPILGRLHARLPPDSPLLPDLERLQRSVAAAYSRGLLQTGADSRDTREPERARFTDPASPACASFSVLYAQTRSYRGGDDKEG